jgi:phosphatidylserine decarboxylase
MAAARNSAFEIIQRMPRERITRFVGKLTDAAVPEAIERLAVGIYSKAYDVDLTGCVVPKRWGSFDAFFTRSLEPGARPLEGDAETFVSPCDGRIEVSRTVDASGTWRVKGSDLHVAELLGSEEDAARYVGGEGVVIYLSPRDYHRVHVPCAAKLTRIVSLAGELYPVNEMGLANVPKLFAVNRRVVFHLDASEAGFGQIALVMVAALVVGRISASAVDSADVPVGEHRFTTPQAYERGDELGIFHLGSTVVLFTEKGAVSGFDGFSAGQKVRMGEAMATQAASNP